MLTELGVLDGVMEHVMDGVCDGVCDRVWLFGKDSFKECPLTTIPVYSIPGIHSLGRGKKGYNISQYN